MTRKIRAALTSYPHTAALKDGTVAVDGYELDFSTSLDDAVAIFRTMSRELRWDMSEMGVTTALCAKEYGVPFTAIPVFVTRRFDHQSISYNVRVISSPQELEGQKIAMRSPNVPDVLWSLAVLQDTYGVDLSKIEWIITGDEHIEKTEVGHRGTLAPGVDLVGLVESGEVAAIMAPYQGESPDVRPLIDDIKGAERDWYATYGYIPLHHTIVVKDELLDSDPTLPSRLSRAFVDAKKPLLDSLARGDQVLEHMDRPRHVFGFDTTAELLNPGDPVPYGVEANRPAMEALLRYAYQQKLLSRPYDIEEVFALG